MACLLPGEGRGAAEALVIAADEGHPLFTLLRLSAARGQRRAMQCNACNAASGYKGILHSNFTRVWLAVGCSLQMNHSFTKARNAGRIRVLYL